MKNFADLLDVVELLESDNRQKAKEFKRRMKPIFKKMGAAQIGDPRRYTFMLLWPFLRDVLNVPEIQGQDTPLNYNVILRKLEEIAERGDLPEDAGDQWEDYANEHFDEFIDVMSATREPRQRKSHTRGVDTKNVVPVAGEEGTGFTDEESASERARRVEQEQKLKKEVEVKGPEEVRAEFQDALDDIAGKLQERGKGVPQFGETYKQQDTYLVEILFDQPVVQKQAALNLFPQEDLASPIERSKRGFDVELKPDSKIAQQIKYHGVDKIEEYLADLISGKLGVETRVNIMEPETEEPAGKLLDVYKGTDVDKDEQDMEEDECGFCSKDSHKHSKDNPVAEEDAEAEATEVLPQGEVTVRFRNGRIYQIDAPEGLDFNIAAVQNNLGKGWNLRDSLISGRNTRGAMPKPAGLYDSVLAYMPPVKEDEEQNNIVLETTRERYKPKTHHQMLDYMRHFNK